MKNIFKVVVIFIICTCTSVAQEEGDFTFSIFAGGGFSNISTSEDQNLAESRLSLSAGVLGTYYFSKSWSLRSGVAYEQQGWTNGVYVSDGGFVNDDANYGLHYISISVQPEFHFGSKNNKNWYVNAGPYYSFLAGANADTTQVKRFFENSDIGLAGGLGYKISFDNKTNSALFFELVSRKGLTNIGKENDSENVTNSKFGLLVGYTF